MMVLSGAMFPFDKLNRKIGSVDKVPVIAELMPTRWTYEALMVSQFKDNRYSKIEFDKEKETFYLLQKKISEADFNKVHRLPELNKALETTVREFRDYANNSASQEELQVDKSTRQFSKLLLLNNELTRITKVSGIPEFRYLNYLTPVNFNLRVADSAAIYLKKLDEIFSKISNSASDRKDMFYNLNSEKLNRLQNDYYNYKLEEIVTKYYERKKILLYNNTLVQNTDPVYLDPDRKGFLSFRTHFYAPAKYIFGIKTDIFIFNIVLVLLSTILLYLALYYDLLGKAVRFFEKLKFRKQVFNA
jgi:hypothetical protein